MDFSLRSFKALRHLGGNIRLHGNRFIQIDLDERGDERVHVWSDLLPAGQDVPTPIHDHTFDFHSRVLLGTLVNVCYEAVPNPFDACRYRLWWAQHRDREDTILVPADVVEYSLLPQDASAYPAGWCYRQKGQVLHATTYIGYAVTHVERRAIRAGYRPRIAVPVGRTPDNTFNRYQYPPEQLWDVVQRVYNLSPEALR